MKAPFYSSLSSGMRDWKLYRLMLKIRMSEQKIIDIYPSDKIQSPIHLSIGQEAVAAGVCLALKSSDRIYGTYRGHGIYIAKGGDLGKMFSELYGKETGCSRGKGGSMHLSAPEVGLVGCSAIVGSFIPVATGDALAAQMRKDSRVVCSFFGDGAVDEGVFFESVNFAILKNLPIVYVCENNGYAIHSKVLDRHKQPSLARLVSGLGLIGKRHDGNDAPVVFKTMSQAITQARKGKGPVFLEYMTNRWHEHVGPGTDYQESYHSPKDKENNSRNDPIKKMEKILKKRKGFSLRADILKKEIQNEIDQAVNFAEKSPFPSLQSLYHDLYAESR